MFPGILTSSPSHCRRRRAPPAPRWTGPPLAPTGAHLAAAGIEIGPDTATPDWHGERLDLGYAIDVLWKPRTDSNAAGARMQA